MKSLSHSLRTLAAAALLGAAGLQAHAAPVNVTVSDFAFDPGSGYGTDSNEASGTLLGVTFTSNFVAQDFSLTAVGDSVTFDVGTVTFWEPSSHGGITSDETDNLGASAWLTFTSPFGSTIEVQASGTAVLGSTNDAAVDLTIDWNDLTVPFGNGGQLAISLADLSFTGNPDLPQTRTQRATVTLLSGPTVVTTDADPRPQQVPEPGTLALAASALAALGFGRRRRA